MEVQRCYRCDLIALLFMSPTIVVGDILFLPCLLVGLLVGLLGGWFAPTLTFCNNFCYIEYSNLIFGMHVYLMELHILSSERSMSSFKIKGQIYGSKLLI